MSARNADVGFVTSVGEQSISVAYRGQGYTEVLHRDDPRLEVTPELRQDIEGLWEFTKESQLVQEKFLLLQERVQVLEDLVKK
jgi:hypothetical protein